MGFLREYGFVISFIAALILVGTIWHMGEKYEAAQTVSQTISKVAPIQAHEISIGNNPLSPAAMLNSLRRYKF